MDGRNRSLTAPVIAGVLLLLAVGTPVVLAETSETTVGIGADDLNARLDRYVERQRFQSRHESREGLPLRPLGLELPATWDRDETDAPILACALPALSLQDEPATQQSGADDDAGTHPSMTLPAHKRKSEDINNQLNNPGADLAQLNFKFTWNHFKGSSRRKGASSQDSLALNFQPVFPFKLDDGGTFILRPTIPVVWKPHYNARSNGFDEQFGLGDIQLDAFYSRTNMKEGYMWGAGVLMQFPTHTDDALGKNQFAMGPAAFAGLIGKWGSAGIFPQHLWNIGGSSEGYTALTLLQPWYWFNVGKGYQVGGSPVIEFDWSQDKSDEAWTVPINLGVAKTIMMGGMPVKFKFEGIYYIVQPDSFGPHYGFQLTITPVIANPFERHVANS